MKNGFTIVELLVTISLLLLVSVLLVPNIMKMSDSVKQTQYESKLELILAAGIDYGEDNINLLKSDKCSCISAGYLIEEGYLKADSEDNTMIIDSRTNKSMNDLEVCVKYEKTFSSANEKQYFKVTGTFDPQCQE